jgi:hypothetical protein
MQSNSLISGQSEEIEPLNQANYPDATGLSPWAGYTAAPVDQREEHREELLTHPVSFHSHFQGCMDLKGDRPTVMRYLDAHQGWFTRCAPPMQVTPLTDNGYEITIGRFGSHGFEVEPKIGLHLLPQEEGVYRIETLTLPQDAHQHYQVDFQASLQVVEEGDSNSPCSRVEWQLDLGVKIQFPRFIYRLPMNLIQYTGDRILTQIVRQVSRRLTAKVQADFHKTQGLYKMD